MSSKKAIEEAFDKYKANKSFYAAGTKLRERVNEARKSRKISMDELSDRVGLESVNALSRILNDSSDKKPENRRAIKYEVMKKLATHLGYSAAYLIGADDDAKNELSGKLDTLITNGVGDSPLKSVLGRFGYTLIGVYSGRMPNINTGQAYWQAEGFETAKEMFDAFISNASEANNLLLTEWSAAFDELAFGEKIFAFEDKNGQIFYIPKSMYKHFEAYALDMLKPLLSGLLFYDPKDPVNGFEYTGEKPLDDALLIDLRSQEPRSNENK